MKKEKETKDKKINLDKVSEGTEESHFDKWDRLMFNDEENQKF